MANKDTNQALRQYFSTRYEFAELLAAPASTRRQARLMKWTKKVTRRAARRLSKVLARDVQ